MAAMQTNRFFSYFFGILLIICILIIVMMRKCKPDDPEVVTVVTEITDTITTHDTVYDLKPVIVVERDSFPIFDTIEVIKEYFKEKTYEYSYQDTNLIYNSEILVTENSIQNLKSTYTIFRKTIIIDNIITQKPTYELFVGAGINTNFKTVGMEVGVDCGWKNNKIGIRYDFINKSMGVNYQYRIFSK